MFAVGDTIEWRGNKGRIRGRIEALSGDTASVRLLRRGQPTDTLRTVSLAEANHSAEVVELFSLVYEMGGTPPDIPLPANVKLDRLRKALGEELFFVTLPIGKVGITSRNGNTYGRQAIVKLVEQVNEKRPEGRWGHLSADEIGTKYEPPAVRWLSAVLDENGVAWGKAVPLTREAARHFEMAEATGARVGTSIFGLEPHKGEAGEIDSYRLVTIDLANAERVGVPLTAAPPHITTEMAKTPSPAPLASTEEGLMDPTARIEELTADRVRLQEQVTGLEKQLQALRPAGTVLADMRKLLELDESADVIKTLRESQDQLKELANENAALLDSAMTAEIAGKVKLESARPIVRKLVEAQKPRTRKALTEALDKTLADDAVKALLAQQLAEQSGPPQSRPATPASGEDWKQYVDIPKEEK